PYVMSIAGFDPSAGAGVLSDIKCFEQHGTYGFGICSAITTQTDTSFKSCDWVSIERIINQATPLLEKFPISACKIGLIEDLSVLLKVISLIKSYGQHICVILDPVMESSSGFLFHDWSLEKLSPSIRKLDLITPNYEEMMRLSCGRSPEETASVLSGLCPVLLKGGHNVNAPGTDFLFQPGKQSVSFQRAIDKVYPKHGSGCVLSAAITANIALGHALEKACREAKKYTEIYLKSNDSLLGYHAKKSQYGHYNR
ncbi:MAG: hydroxymethylpyrimidine/phosphomethylpyrimidine kinase, partial [Pedobacter sp.]